MQTNPGSVLIYGASGAQGSAIARAALDAGIHVRLLLRDRAVNRFGAEVDIVRGDLGDSAGRSSGTGRRFGTL